MDRDIILITSLAIQPVNILGNQPRPIAITCRRQPVMNDIRLDIAIGGKAFEIPQQELPGIMQIHIPSSHFLGRVMA